NQWSCTFTMSLYSPFLFVFFFHDSAPTEIYTLSLHDALPIWHQTSRGSSTWDDLMRDLVAPRDGKRTAASFGTHPERARSARACAPTGRTLEPSAGS